MKPNNSTEAQTDPSERAKHVSEVCGVIDAVRTSCLPANVFWASDFIKKLEVGR